MRIEEQRNILPLEQYRSMQFRDFFHRFSDQDVTLDGFDLEHVYAVTTETEYPDSLDAITVRGGLHLAVAGGLDPVLGQIAIVKPDLSILCDANAYAVPVIQDRLSLLADVSDGKQYWEQLPLLLANQLSDSLSLAGDITDLDLRTGGWSSQRYFDAVKKSWTKNTIKFIHADITTQGLTVGRQLAEKTDTQITLLSVSNIFDYDVNHIQLAAFQEKLVLGVADGTIASDAQIVSASVYNNMANTVQNITDFIRSSYRDLS